MDCIWSPRTPQEQVRREIAATDAAIGRLVEELYGLTESFRTLKRTSG